MDLRYTDAEEAFRARAARAGWPTTLPGLPAQAVARPTGPAGAPTTPTGSACSSTPATPASTGPSRAAAAASSPVEELIFKEELERAHAPYVGVNFVGLLHAGPTIIAEGTPEQRPRYLPADPAGRRGLVPGLLRARRRQRPGLAAHPGRARRRRLRRHRIEDLDLARRGGRLLRAAGAHRRRGQPPPRHHVADPAHGHPGRRHPAAPHHRRLDRVRRALPRRGPGAGGQPGRRRERRLAGDHGHPQLRTRAPPSSATCSRPSSCCRPRWPWPGAPAPGRTRASGARPAICEPSSTRCGR